MEDGHNKLKSIGAQKIHEATHISRLHVQAVIHESYDDMTKIQFLGFISILEREYALDLSGLKSRGIAYFDDLSPISTEVNKVFVNPQKKKNYTLLFALIAVVIFVAVSYQSINFSSKSSKETNIIDNTNIKNATTNRMTSEVEEKVDKNETIIVKQASILDKQAFLIEDDLNKSLIIKPSTDLWLGYLDLDSNKNYQITIQDEFILDVNKTWLLTFGHGYFSVNINGDITKYNDKNTLRFIYKDSNLTKISYKKFLQIKKEGRW